MLNNIVTLPVKKDDPRPYKAEGSRDGTPQHPRSDVVRSGAFGNAIKNFEGRPRVLHQHGNIQTI